MTENETPVTDAPEDTQEITQPTPEERLVGLKAKADSMGIRYSHQIGPDTLSKKINNVLDGIQEDEINEALEQAKPVTATDLSKVVTPERVVKMREAKRLVLVKVVCMNPSKKEWDGEVITVGNSVVGTDRKFVKFNADRGWYITKFMYNVLLARKCQLFKTIKINGRKVRQGYLVNEFAITLLPNPSTEELAREAFKQAAKASVED